MGNKKNSIFVNLIALRLPSNEKDLKSCCLVFVHFLSKCNHDFRVLDLLGPSHVKNISIPHLPWSETAANSSGYKVFILLSTYKAGRCMSSPV